MHVTLVHNPFSGHDAHDAEALCGILRRHGHRVRYVLARDELDEPPAARQDLVVAAGGDGTVQRVARRLAGSGIPMTAIPLGTANNIATALGITGSAEDLVGAWPGWTLHRLDLGVLSGPWGQSCFVEAMGVGLFAETLRTAELGPPAERLGARAELARDRRVARRLLAGFRPVGCHLELDGRDMSGDYYLLAALNLPRFGPGLALAAGVDPTDGLLDVILVAEDAREALACLLEADGPDQPSRPALPRLRARELRLDWRGQCVHADSRFWGGHGAGRGPVVAGVRARALTFLAPPYQAPHLRQPCS